MQILKWDPSKIRDVPRILLIGRSGSGKSTALRDLLSYLADRVDLCLMFSPTTESLDEFRKLAPPSCIHPGALKLDVVETALRLNRELAASPSSTCGTGGHRSRSAPSATPGGIRSRPAPRGRLRVVSRTLV